MSTNRTWTVQTKHGIQRFGALAPAYLAALRNRSEVRTDGKPVTITRGWDGERKTLTARWSK